MAVVVVGECKMCFFYFFCKTQRELNLSAPATPRQTGALIEAPETHRQTDRWTEIITLQVSSVIDPEHIHYPGTHRRKEERLNCCFSCLKYLLSRFN